MNLGHEIERRLPRHATVEDQHPVHLHSLTARVWEILGMPYENHQGHEGEHLTPCDEIRCFQAAQEWWDGKYGEGAWDANPMVAIDLQDVDTHQALIAQWVEASWGRRVLMDRKERLDRLIEEIIELAQAEDYPEDRIAAITNYVYRRPAGEVKQEVGGVYVTFMGYGHAAGVDVHACGRTEIARVLTIDREKLRAKHAAKVAQGITSASVS